MKAAVYRRYGPPDVVRVEEVEKPTAGDNEVLVRVGAAALNPLDRHLLRAKPYSARLLLGLFGPRNGRLGRDVAGQVEAVGGKVTRFKPGDEVFGACRGACAEYACAAEDKLALKPCNFSFEQSAALPVAALSALQGLRDKGRVQPGQRVLINGAAGGVGTYAVQIAKVFGAEVTGVCSTRNVEMVRSLGADHVFDYTKEDFTRSGQRYDIVLDCIGNHPLTACRRILQPKGKHIIVGGPNPRWMIVLLAGMLKTLVFSLFVSQKIAPFMAAIKQEDLAVLKEMAEAGTIASVIDKRYPLSEVTEALRHLETGHARGKIVITMD